MTASILDNTGAADLDGHTQALLEELRKAGEKMSPADRREQAINYALGCAAGDDPAARARLRRHLEETYGMMPGSRSSMSW